MCGDAGDPPYTQPFRLASFVEVEIVMETSQRHEIPSFPVYPAKFSKEYGFGWQRALRFAESAEGRGSGAERANYAWVCGYGHTKPRVAGRILAA